MHRTHAKRAQGRSRVRSESKAQFRRIHTGGPGNPSRVGRREHMPIGHQRARAHVDPGTVVLKQRADGQLLGRRHAHGGPAMVPW